MSAWCSCRDLNSKNLVPKTNAYADSATGTWIYDVLLRQRLLRARIALHNSFYPTLHLVVKSQSFPALQSYYVTIYFAFSHTSVPDPQCCFKHLQTFTVDTVTDISNPCSWSWFGGFLPRTLDFVSYTKSSARHSLDDGCLQANISYISFLHIKYVRWKEYFAF